MSKYVEISNEIISNIKDNTLKVNDSLPSENELQKQYGVSRDTIRKSLDILKSKGYIKKQRGSKTKIKKPKDYKFPFSKVSSFKELNQNLDREVNTNVLNLQIVQSNKDLKSIFGKEKELFEVLRTREINGSAVILDRDFFKRSVVPNLPLRACQDSIYEYLEDECHIEIGYAYKDITVENATQQDKKLLNLEGYNLVIVVKSYSFTKDKNLFQYTESRHRPDQFHFSGFAQRQK